MKEKSNRQELSVRQAYNSWADQYDTNSNRTRDLEAVSLIETLENVRFTRCIEIGCGTGKNTVWLAARGRELVAVDFSEEMLAKAREKIGPGNVKFIRHDINREWIFATGKVDLITFSLVLEHIENLDFIFKQMSETVVAGGHVYIGELHPFKQYSGTKARFDTEQGQQMVTCYTHHISDFTNLAVKYGFQIMVIHEYFDDKDKNTIPRIFTLLLRKK